jgi:hypothetical protein
MALPKLDTQPIANVERLAFHPCIIDGDAAIGKDPIHVRQNQSDGLGYLSIFG